MLDSALVQLEGATKASQPLNKPYSLFESLAGHGLPPEAVHYIKLGLGQRLDEYIASTKVPS